MGTVRLGWGVCLTRMIPRWLTAVTRQSRFEDEGDTNSRVVIPDKNVTLNPETAAGTTLRP